MSWMDSWSRPSKHAVTPPPLYLTVGEDVPYCHTCGRIIGSRKTHAHAQQEVKYCSTRCRNNKPGPVDRKIEATFVALLNGANPADVAPESKNPDTEPNSARPKQQQKGKKKSKGDSRNVVECSDVEGLVFKHPKDPEKVFGRKKNRAARGVVEKEEEWKSVDMVDDPEPPKAAGGDASGTGDIETSDTSTIEEDHMAGGVPLDIVDEYGYGGGKIRPPQEKSDVNGSVGGEKGWAERIEETEDMKAKRREGQRRAEEKEMVKRAARRLCAFGVLVPKDDLTEEGIRKKGQEAGDQRKKCEAVMKGTAVEPSYAKGDWGIRWRQKV